MNCILDHDYSLLQHHFSSADQSDFRFRSSVMTPRVCFLECLNQGPNIAFYGLKNGIDCYCGEKLRYFHVKSEQKILILFSFHRQFNGIDVPRSSCNIPCPGDPSENCGGSKELRLFSMIGIF